LPAHAGTLVKFGLRFDMTSKKIFLTAAFLGNLIVSVCAEVRLAEVFTDHMVLQRDRPVPVWGKANPG